MEGFGLAPGPQVGKILHYIEEQYPDITELSEALIKEIEQAMG